jgi:hypothetical protein
MTFTLNLDYSQPDTKAQLYPALQADNYQPKAKDKISICLNEESFMILSDRAKELLEFTVIEAEFKNGSTNIFQVNADLRVMPLAMPNAFCYHRPTERYRTIASGVTFKENGLVSASRIHFCASVGGELLLAEDGNPQVFTLNLKSMKTQLIRTQKPVKGDGSLYSWNEEMKAAYKGRGWLLHMFGFKLSAKPEKFVSRDSGDSSMGIMFELQDPQIIASEHQKLIHEELQSPVLKESIKNPYKLGVAVQQTAQAIPSTVDGHPGYTDLDGHPGYEDAMPF